MEYWDIIDKNRVLTGRKHIRGIPMNEGDFHLVVEIWIINNSKKMLLTKRHPDKPWPNLWECTGGSVISCENSKIGALREVEEEIGIELEPESGRIIYSYLKEDSFHDVWLYRKDIELQDTKLQEREVIDIKWVDKAQLREMFQKSVMVPPLNYILDLIESDKELITYFP
jgi:8-oxo-dGTP diphosphatase